MCTWCTNGAYNSQQYINNNSYHNFSIIDIFFIHLVMCFSCLSSGSNDYCSNKLSLKKEKKNHQLQCPHFAYITIVELNLASIKS